MTETELDGKALVCSRCRNREGSKDDGGSLSEEHHREKGLRYINSAKKRAGKTFRPIGNVCGTTRVHRMTDDDGNTNILCVQKHKRWFV